MEILESPARASRDASGADLVLTAEERALAEAQARDLEAEGRRAEAAKRLSAEERIKQLEEEIAKLRGG